MERHMAHPMKTADARATGLAIDSGRSMAEFFSTISSLLFVRVKRPGVVMPIAGVAVPMGLETPEPSMIEGARLGIWRMLKGSRPSPQTYRYLLDFALG